MPFAPTSSSAPTSKTAARSSSPSRAPDAARARPWSGMARFNNVRPQPRRRVRHPRHLHQPRGQRRPLGGEPLHRRLRGAHLDRAEPDGQRVIGLSGDVNAGPRGAVQRLRPQRRRGAAGVRQRHGLHRRPTRRAAPTCRLRTTDACVQVTCPDGSAPFTSRSRRRTRRATSPADHRQRCAASRRSPRCASSRRRRTDADRRDDHPQRGARRQPGPRAPGRRRGVHRPHRGRPRCSSPRPDATRDGHDVVAHRGMGDPCATLGMGFVGIARFPA
jgi:hypothetical protein